MFGGIYAPYPPPGSATGDKPNATTFIKPQLEFFIIKLCNFESVSGAIQLSCFYRQSPVTIVGDISINMKGVYYIT